MNTYVPRHDLNREPEEEIWELNKLNREAWSARLDTEDASTIYFSLTTLYLNAMYSVHSDPDAAQVDTWEAWTTAMQMYHAMFAMTTNPPGTELELMVNHQVRHPQATGPRYCTNASNWLTAFFLAVVCRDQQRYRQLCEIPVDRLREAGESEGTQYNPFTYHWISALQAFVLNRPGLGEELLAAMELSAPDRVDIGSPELMEMIVFPPMNTFLRLVERDTEKFNDALAQGLELFRTYQTSDAERTRDIEGVVSLPLLALACLAYDTDQVDSVFRLEVESGYLPKHLVQRSWYGEFPV
ncbi:immunity 49 family protein [Nocardiopsis alborubida]|uniref:Immunity 49 family protein n=1 Tax=Nocardiopsis alborubida TaxID=146802 RepID=A0A7X6MEN9_9ACTN|nr:immunity 49 family protein [Nocardiopsis alborubida]NKY98205.1 immunity 49 family protein [Nocardiopsis alborubida]